MSPGAEIETEAKRDHAANSIILLPEKSGSLFLLHSNTDLSKDRGTVSQRGVNGITLSHFRRGVCVTFSSSSFLHISAKEKNARGSNNVGKVEIIFLVWIF